MIVAIDSSARRRCLVVGLRSDGSRTSEWGADGTAAFVASRIRSLHAEEAITAVVVSLGPGSYTGVRAGIAAAAGAAQAAGLPLFGVPTLELAPLAAVAPGRVRSVADAGRGGAYVADYDVRPGTRPQEVTPARRVDVTSLTADGVERLMGLSAIEGIELELVDHAAALASAASIALTGEPLDLGGLRAIQVAAPSFERAASRV